MKLLVVSCAMAAACLSGCGRAPDGSITGNPRHGRFAGVGVYPAGQMWSQMVGANAKDPAVSRTNDDEQVIVVVDSNTGELRECGNLTGYCVGMQPWVKSLAAGQLAPVTLAKHLGQIETEAAAKAK